MSASAIVRYRYSLIALSVVLIIGRNELRSLCQRFGIESSAVLILNDFSDYVENLGRGQMPFRVRCLRSCIDTIPCSTAECERGFSSMNIVFTDLRNRLLVVKGKYEASKVEICSRAFNNSLSHCMSLVPILSLRKAKSSKAQDQIHFNFHSFAFPFDPIA